MAKRPAKRGRATKTTTARRSSVPPPENGNSKVIAGASGRASEASSKSGASQTIHTILDQFRDDARSKRDLGDRFERLMQQFFQLDPTYSERFAKVYMWNDWPRRGKFADKGIDLVAEEKATGECVAIQCKFYDPDSTLQKGDIDSFFTEAGKDAFSSGIIVSTTDKWSTNAEDALRNQSKPFNRVSVGDLDKSAIDWSRFDSKSAKPLTLRDKKTLRPHQTKALEEVSAGLKLADRGKMIMACGTGKTFTALRIAEHIAPGGNVLFLVPSLALMSQTLREWTAEAAHTLHPMSVCSDADIDKRAEKANASSDAANGTAYDLPFPATTRSGEIIRQHKLLGKRRSGPNAKREMTVVFSTYQSIDAVSRAQKDGLPDFDLVVCDEAHRTTGVTLTGEDESHFVKVHDPKFLKAAKRLYMTATPRIYGDEAKSKAKEAEAELCSMDDEKHFGKELHRLGFGEAVGKSLLSDYKVLVLAVDEKYVNKTFQRQLADKDNELKLEDAVKITGCWNGLAKRFDPGADAPVDLTGDSGPMHRAVAFSRSIKDSKRFVEQFTQLQKVYREAHPDTTIDLHCECDHVDGTFNALDRNRLIDWLKADTEGDCRILSNCRCLSEGVDVPALDAVIFLNPRNSIIDVVQSVGRVMRRAEGKQYGYIVLPVGIPADTTPEEALKDNEKYRVVWQVLQALRAHDDRFNATINQIELNTKRPDNIQVIGITGGEPGAGAGSDGDSKPKATQATFNFPQLDEWKDAIYAKLVLKCGDRLYWETWAKDVAVIAERHITRIKTALQGKGSKHREAFAEFLAGLHQNINTSITEDDAIEMLAQHLITKPVFDALFAGYQFTTNNPVSQSMQTMLDALGDQAMEKETETLEKFYKSVRERAAGIDNPKGRHKVVIELYEKFFRVAFKRTADRLGIVYTPVEVVDFIIRSVEDVLRSEFGSSISDKDVHIIDPFTGTGSFMVRLIESKLIAPPDLRRKYTQELHANELILLAYYIAAVNIEEAFHLLSKADGGGGQVEYIPFGGIVLTDTFQLAEKKGDRLERMFPENNRRVQRQQKAPIRVVIGNPPYSVGQGDANENNQNLDYPEVDRRIGETYAKQSTATNKNSLYASEIRALRWATDRIVDRGIVAFVTNNSFVDKNTMDGLRACLASEFSSLYVFNLRGYQRTSGETSKREGGKVFGSGSRNGIAICLLVKDTTHKGPARIRYRDIGDYLSREDKLAIVADFRSVARIGKANLWESIVPNADHDWINQRDPAFEKFVSIGDKKDENAATVFETYSRGVATSRDVWCYNFSESAISRGMKGMLAFYAEQLAGFMRVRKGDDKGKWIEQAEAFIDTDRKKIAWSRGLVNDVARGTERRFNRVSVRRGVYRPFCKQWMYFDRYLNDMIYQLPRIFPTPAHMNLALCVTSPGNRDAFSLTICDALPDLHMADKSGGSQCFPLFIYEPMDDGNKNHGLIDVSNEGEVIDGYRRRSAITDAILKQFQAAYGPNLTKEDIFYYVYGILHSPEYRRRFASDLNKMLPRIPLTREAADFRAFAAAGRELAHWHLNYETIDPYPLEEFSPDLGFDKASDFAVTQMFYPSPTPEQKAKGEKKDKTRIVYNGRITLTGIPPEALDYVVNGKPALEWVMERYQVTVDKDSGIANDPNDWAKEHRQPRYIIDLVKRVVRVSVETVKIVNSLPRLNERVQG